ncbi:MAG: helix-turn-helix domain-containing protein [Candidatus Moraniibacteriota bacterium]
MSMIEKDIQSLGLNEKEAKVYLASLELGQATVQRISMKASIKRPTTYFIIENLMERGLMSSYYQGKKQLFMAEMPERILDLIAKERKELELREEQFKRLLPELQSINNRNKDKPVVKYYEGREGILTMTLEHMKSSRNQEIYNVFSRDIIEQVITSEELKEIRKERLGSKLSTKTIYTREEGDLHGVEDASIVRLSEKDFPVTCDIAFYEDKVRIASFKNRLMGVVIEDKEIAQSFRAVFELAWKWVNRDVSK